MSSTQKEKNDIKHDLLKSSTAGRCHIKIGILFVDKKGQRKVFHHKTKIVQARGKAKFRNQKAPESNDKEYDGR